MNFRVSWWALAGAFLVALVALGACEQAFTTSPLSWLERDPDNLSKERQIRYAEAALRSGNERAARKAYDALSKNVDEKDDPELNLLLADLAMNAAGISEVLSELLTLALGDDTSLGDPGDLDDTFGAKLNALNYDYVLAAKEQIEAAHTKDERFVAGEQSYLEISLGLVLRAAGIAGGFLVDPPWDSAEVEAGEAADFVDLATVRLDDRSGGWKYVGDFGAILP